MKYTIALGGLIVVAMLANKLVAMNNNDQEDSQDALTDMVQQLTITDFQAGGQNTQDGVSQAQRDALTEAKKELIAYFQGCLNANIEKINKATSDQGLATCIHVIKDRADDNFGSISLCDLDDNFEEMMKTTRNVNLSLEKKQTMIVSQLHKVVQHIIDKAFASPLARRRVLNASNATSRLL